MSTKTLRYYDEIQLIIPDIDENNNYRYYTKDQIQDIITTKKLKNAGLKLNEIRDYLQKNQRQDKVKLLNRKIEDCSRSLRACAKAYCASAISATACQTSSMIICPPLPDR